MEFFFKIAFDTLFIFFCYDAWRKHDDKYFLAYIFLMLVILIDSVWDYLVHNLFTFSQQNVLISDISSIWIVRIIFLLTIVIVVAHIFVNLKRRGYLRGSAGSDS